jgi:hypothetical protein
MILSMTLAMAAGPVDAPGLVTFAAPAAGVTRVRLPPDAAGANPADLARHLELFDAAGQRVPFALYTTESLPWNTEFLDVLQVDTHVWKVGPSVREVARLEFPEVIGGWHPGELTVDGVGHYVFPVGTVQGEEARFDTVPVPPGRGPWIVRGGDHIRTALGHSLPDGFVAPDCVTLDPGAPALTERGFARYSLELGGPRRVRSLTVNTDADLFSREVAVSGPAEGVWTPYAETSGVISRSRVETASYDSTRIENLDLAGDILLLDVHADVGRILPLTSVEVCSVGAEIVLRDPGPGPLALYVGGEAVGASTDLAFAGGDLVNLASTRVTDLAVVDNPDFVATETREGLDTPGAVLPVVKWRWSRSIEGSGWVRIPLGREVLAHARSDALDVRIVDAADRAVPFVMRNTGRESAWPETPFSREEEGSTSLIRVPLGMDLAPVSTVRLRTSRQVFSREVTVLSDRGAVTEPLRSVTWAGDQQGVELAIALDTVLSSELLVRIENGDNAPLELESIALASPERELRANVPQGSRLVYGSPRGEAPSYDLALLSDALVRRRLGTATLGPEEVIAGAVLPTSQRLVVLAVVGTLAAGLVLMMVRLLLSKPAAADAAPGGNGPGEGRGSPPADPSA